MDNFDEPDWHVPTSPHDDPETYEREKREDQERWEEYQRTGHGIDNDVVIQWMEDLVAGKDRPCPQ